MKRLGNKLITIVKDNTIIIFFVLSLGGLFMLMILCDFPDALELKVTFLSLVIAIFGQLIYRIQARHKIKESIKNHISVELYSSLLLLISGTNEIAFNLTGLTRLKEHTDIINVEDASEIFVIYAQLEHYEDVWKNRQNYPYSRYILEKKFQVICYILHLVDDIDWKRFMSILSWKINHINYVNLEYEDDLLFVKEFPGLYNRIGRWIDVDKFTIPQGIPKSPEEVTQQFLNWIIDDIVKRNTTEYSKKIHKVVMRLIK